MDGIRGKVSWRDAFSAGEVLTAALGPLERSFQVDMCVFEEQLYGDEHFHDARSTLSPHIEECLGRRPLDGCGGTSETKMHVT